MDDLGTQNGTRSTTPLPNSGNIANMLASQLSRSIHAIDATLLEINRSNKGPRISTRLSACVPHSTEKHYTICSWTPWPPATGIQYRRCRQRRAGCGYDCWLANAEHQCRGPRLFPGCTRPDRQSFEHINSSQKQGRWNLDDCLCPAPGELERRSSPGLSSLGVNTKYFEDIYGSIRSVQSLLFTLVNPDGIILARYPQGQDFVGRRLSTEADRLEIIASKNGNFRVLAKTDGKVRHVSVRAMPEYPLFVNVSVTEDTALTNWRRRAATIGLGSAILLACSIYLSHGGDKTGSSPEQIRKIPNAEVKRARRA